ncbi:PTS sugar transporter subunit IIA [Clostridium sp. MSJ-4]|uniref:PTS sugar transporter subunit IIA n=1 Tax=Clostridium simiarum TaxID=2841506 RepID=A0ABS6EZ92_9CLOT|nr:MULTISPECIES: PTS sugar transporter subunit IIA [Clostridium]MBU5591559.1 PTS sugar transporter subunit IIA [Clostridium simiarum]
MRKILIASHGKYADGVKSATNIIIGNKENVHYLNAYVSEESVEEQMNNFFKEVNEDDEVIILTDIYGGSVNQKIFPYLKRENVYIISGFNLAVVLEILLLSSEEKVSLDQLRNIVEEGKKQILFINDYFEENSKKDDFDI